MFSLACNLIISDQIREQLVQIPWNIFISKNYINEISKRQDIKDDDQRYQGVRHYGVSKTSVTFRYQLKALCEVLSWSVSLRYQLVCRYNVSNWSVLITYQWDVTKTSQIGQNELTYLWWRHYDVSAWSRTFQLVTKRDQFLLRTMNHLCFSGDSVSLKYQLVHCYNVSTSFSFRYQFWPLWDLLSWEVWLRYHLVHPLDVSSWSVLFTCQWDVAKTSQIDPSHWRTRCNVAMTS